MRRKIPMDDIDVRGSHKQECGDEIVYKRSMDDAHEKDRSS